MLQQLDEELPSLPEEVRQNGTSSSNKLAALHQQMLSQQQQTNSTIDVLQQGLRATSMDIDEVTERLQSEQQAVRAAVAADVERRFDAVDLQLSGIAMDVAAAVQGSDRTSNRIDDINNTLQNDISAVKEMIAVVAVNSSASADDMRAGIAAVNATLLKQVLRSEGTTQQLLNSSLQQLHLQLQSTIGSQDRRIDRFESQTANKLCSLQLDADREAIAVSSRVAATAARLESSAAAQTQRLELQVQAVNASVEGRVSDAIEKRSLRAAVRRGVVRAARGSWGAVRSVAGAGVARLRSRRGAAATVATDISSEEKRFDAIITAAVDEVNQGADEEIVDL